MSDRINRQVPIHERPDYVGRLPHDLQRAGARVFLMNGCSIIVTHEPPDGWHLSIARPDRDPTWDEIATARYRVLPDVIEMAMYLPRLEDYVNVHNHTFHLYEVQKSVIARVA